MLAASVRGTAHLRAGSDCQDAALVRLVVSGQGDPAVLLAASDGAGSAEHSQEGSALVCRAVLRELERLSADPGFDPAALDAAALLSGLRTELEQYAEERGYHLRELACTLLAGLVLPRAAWWVQVGDGAIVFEDAAGLHLHVWPDNGEYANQTYFVTDAPAKHLHAALCTGEIRRAALLTDGLQDLALSSASRAPHAPFFDPVFRALEQAGEGWAATLPEGLRQFLDSAAVNARTSDDKTLVLACRTLDAFKVEPEDDLLLIEVAHDQVAQDEAAQTNMTQEGA